MKGITRRDFMKSSMAAGSPWHCRFPACAERMTAFAWAWSGLGGRGTGAHIPAFESQKDVSVVAVSDPDRSAWPTAAR